MEIVIAVALGVWVMLAGLLSYIHMERDERRENT